MANGKRALTSAELSSFCNQVALILSAGLPLYDGMETLAETAKGSEYADVYESLSKAVNETGSLYQALQKDDRWTLGADFNWMQWSKFAREGASDVLQDAWSVSAGGEFIPRHTSVTGYFSRVAYRIGGFYERGFICLPGNDGGEHHINKVGFTAGMSLPLPKTLSKVNLALEVGQYGTRDAGLIQERYLKVNVGVSVYERWFMKRKYK